MNLFTQSPRVCRARILPSNLSGKISSSSQRWPTPLFVRYASDHATNNLLRTPLYDLHVRHKAKMVPFAGYSMPVQYDDLSVGDSHRWTREKASLFDVGHMVQHRLSGPGAASLLLKLTPSSITTLPTHHSTLSCLLHPHTGGIVDDTVITRLGPELFYLVTNAACRAKDTEYITQHLHDHQKNQGKIDWEVLDNWGLIALQGPLSASILQPLIVPPPSPSSTIDIPAHEDLNLETLYFGQSRFFHLRLSNGNISSLPMLISRGGYTGEDGFEISIPPSLTISTTQSLLDSAGTDRLRLAGLGARDSLRLEAGMCLYGHDLDDTTTPVEAGLGWIIGKDRRIEGGFFGDEVILRQLRPVKEGGVGIERRRVGFVVDGSPAREGAEILSSSNEENPTATTDDGRSGEGIIGRITSGCPSPSLGSNIAMGYIKTGYHKAGTIVDVIVRGKKRKATVTKMPFVKTRYWKGITAPA